MDGDVGVVFSGSHAGGGSRFETCGGRGCRVEKIEKISRTFGGLCGVLIRKSLYVCGECLRRVAAGKLR